MGFDQDAKAASVLMSNSTAPPYEFDISRVFFWDKGKNEATIELFQHHKLPLNMKIKEVGIQTFGKSSQTIPFLDHKLSSVTPKSSVVCFRKVAT